MTMYAVTATATWTSTDVRGDTWTATRELPTFYLDSNTQGIVSEQHAQTIARELFDWLPQAPGTQVFVDVAEVLSA